MIAALHIENIAVIRSADVDFNPGFTVFTGETGAGKSLLLDSINLLLGARASRELIRSGCERAFVSAIFSGLSEKTQKLLAENDFSADENGCITLSRSVFSDGKSQTKLNGRTITVAFQKELAPMLLTVHGQHDSGALLNFSSYREYVDAYAENGELLSEYTSAFAEINRIRKEIRELSMSEREKARKTEQLKFEIADIDEAKLSPDEESSLEERRNLVKNIEKTIKSTRLATRALYRSEKGMPAYELVKRASAAIESISDCIPESDAIISRLNEILFELEDIGNTLESYTKVDFDDPTAELDRIETRLDEIGRLKRKYGSDIAEILEFRKKAAAELDDIEISDVKIKELTYELKAAGDKARKIAESLSAKRRSAAAELSSAITEELKYLEMPKVRFCVEVKVLRDDKGASQLGPNGGDEVEFMFSANPGEPLKPLSKIASGGELSRVMLALKTAGHDRSGSETMIFDEIDSGVSGKTAQKIGMRLRGISEGTQVICVTHSAQVASSASWQYLIEKRENDGRSETNLKLLSKDERVYEIARIMGGVEITEKLLDTARELLETSEIYENKQLSKNTGD